MSQQPRGEPGRLPEPPQFIGPYRILERLGEGGMGVVYLGERSEPVHARVAIKVIKLGMDSREVLARFEQERELLARLDHHCIARVLDAGVAATGQPYFAMEYIPGLPLVQYCDERRLGVRARIDLFLQVCGAVQHAHQKGLIHRDLTPRNILVREENDKPVPKLIDFGLARAVDHTGLLRSVFTEQGRILGTVEYMSPEQAAMSPFDIDTRTDIYSLGVILYELLSGELPLPSAQLRHAGMLEMQRCILEVDPSPPSSRLSQRTPGSDLHARARATTTERLRRVLLEDLDWVTMRALEKDRRQRYQTVQNLADDLGHYLRGEPVDAGPPSLTYRLRKWAARHRVTVAAGLLVGSILVIGLAASTWLWKKAEHASVRAQTAERETRLDADTDLAAELLREAEEVLWPKNSTRVDAMQAWLQRSEELLARVAEHQLRRPILEQRLADAAPGPARELAQLAVQRATRCQRDLASLQRVDGVTNRVRVRLAEAKQNRQRSLEGTAAEWDRARSEVAVDARFGGLVLEPIEGLVPLGADPTTKLQEFLVLGTGMMPRRERNTFPMDPDLGIVLVLLPPGDFVFGDTDRKTINKNKRIHIDAFLIGKYELTQAQYLMLTGERGAMWRTNEWELEDPTLVRRRPMEFLSLERAEQALARVGLQVTTEGQWEYACRAGRGNELPWGTDISRMGLHANIADLTAKQFRMQGVEALDFARTKVTSTRDGHVLTAPVGSLQANAYGLYDMFGNVFEWCRGEYVGDPAAAIRSGDGLVQEGAVPRALAVVRGGCYASDEAVIDYPYSQAVARTNKLELYGVRAARSLR